jgi:transglutaminase-like putative cysteine protease
MRIRISHQTTYRYHPPAKGVLQVLHLTPSNYDGQHVLDWRIEPTDGCRLIAQEDAFGNTMHVLAGDGPIDRSSVIVEGRVETSDQASVVRGAVERFPPSLYLRTTPLSAADTAIRDFAQDAAAAAGGDRLKLLHLVLARLHGDMRFETGQTDAATTAAQAFALRRGVCQDLSHVFIAVCRLLGIPARYVGGYFLRGDGVVDQEAGHAWAEALVPGLGWVGFDPANGICITEAHVRVAIGLDYLGAAPIRGAQFGGGAETMSVEIRVDQAARPGQRQSQGPGQSQSQG